MLGNPFVLSLIVILSMMVFVYIIALVKDDYSVVDIFWPVGFFLVSYFLWDGEGSLSQNLIMLFVTVWSVRLCSYLFYL